MQIRGDLELAAIEDFLTAQTIPIRIACHTPGEELWMLSLWFLYRDGLLQCATSKQADVVRYLDHDDGVAFEISTNEPPYRGVRGRGTASVHDDPEKALLRELLDRYLGGTDSSLGNRLLSEKREEVAIRIDPAVVFGWDFSERMQEHAK